MRENQQPIRLLLVGPDNLYRNGLLEALASDDIQVVGTSTDEVEAIQHLYSNPCDVVLVDASLPFEAAAEVIRGISGTHSETPVLVTGTWAEQDKVLFAVDAGATGFLSRKSSPEELRSQVLNASAGQSPIASDVGGMILASLRQRRPVVRLSARELEILDLVCSGLGNKQIASRLGISEKTVKAHLSRMFQRLGVTDRTQAAVWAERNGLNKVKDAEPVTD